MEVNNKMKHTIKVAWAKGFSQFLALAGAILLVFVLFKFDAIMAQIMRIINILMPIIMGIVLAYLINPMVEFYDRKLSNSLGKAIEKKCGKRPSMRGLSILISLAIIIAIIVVLIMMVVPQLVSNITNAVSLLPDQIQDLVKKITELAKNNDKAKEMITKKDKQRQSYYNYYSSKKWGRADSYDLCINSSILGIEGTVKLIIQYVEDFEKKNNADILEK